MYYSSFTILIYIVGVYTIVACTLENILVVYTAVVYIIVLKVYCSSIVVVYRYIVVAYTIVVLL